VEKVTAALRGLEEMGATILENAARRIEDESRAGDDRVRRLVRAARSLLDLESADLRRRRERTRRGAMTLLTAARRDLGRHALSIPRITGRLLEGRRSVLEQMVRQVVQGARRDFSSSARRLSEMAALLGPRTARRLALDAARVEARARRLYLVDPRRVVERGYAILRTPGGSIVTDAATAPAGIPIRADLRRGALRLRSEGPERMDEGGG
jgi:exodeoxyribonuclease VII large subunit